MSTSTTTQPPHPAPAGPGAPHTTDHLTSTGQDPYGEDLAWQQTGPVDADTPTGPVLFDGDTGKLKYPQRRALVTLLKHRFITAQSHPQDYKALLANTPAIRSRLNDLFLDLVLDTARQVAFKRQARPETAGTRFPTLLHDTAWPREETALMVYLRSRARAEEIAGHTRTFVDKDDMLEHLASLRHEHATDHKADSRRAERAVESMIRAGLLVGAADATRFQVSPAIDVILPLEKLTELLHHLQPPTTPDDTGTPATEDTGAGVDTADVPTPGSVP